MSHRIEVHELERIAARAMIEAGFNPCAEGHSWQHTGACNCGCEDGCCSVPVHECALCGDCDYGDNDEADDKRRDCAALSQGEPRDD